MIQTPLNKSIVDVRTVKIEIHHEMKSGDFPVEVTTDLAKMSDLAFRLALILIAEERKRMRGRS